MVDFAHPEWNISRELEDMAESHELKRNRIKPSQECKPVKDLEEQKSLEDKEVFVKEIQKLKCPKIASK